MADLFGITKNEDEHDVNKRINERKRLKNVIQRKLPNYLDGKTFGITDEEEIEALKRTILDFIIKKEDTFLYRSEITEFLDEFVLEITGLGFLTSYLNDPSVTEIMINAHDDIRVEKNHTIIQIEEKFESETKLLEFAERVARNVGRVIDVSHPIVDARLPDGSRVNIIIPPLARNGTTITIRKFFKERLTVENLIEKKTLNQEMSDFLKKCVIAKANLMVSGGTSSGKTTTLNVLSGNIPDNERVITIEDSAELQLNNSHVVSLETKNANAEGSGGVDIRDLVVNSLRMRPDRIIVGETRDKTAYDLLNAMSTGHEGSMSTAHANDPENFISRMTNLVMESNIGLSEQSVRALIGESIDIIVQISSMRDNVRRITHISQVQIKDGNIIVEPIYLFQTNGELKEDGLLKGDFVRTDIPLSNRILHKFMLAGISYDKSEN